MFLKVRVISEKDSRRNDLVVRNYNRMETTKQE